MDQEVHIVSTQKNIYFCFIEYSRAFDFIDYTIVVGSLKKQESSRKISTSALLTMPKPLTVWITTK